MRQGEILKAYEENGSIRKAAAALSISSSTVQDVIRVIKNKAAKQGYAPDNDMTHTVPAPFIVKGVSTYYNAEGQVAGQWVKSTADQQKLEEMMRAAIDGMKDEIPKVKPTKGIDHLNDHLLNCYVITDYHLGMLSWYEETGEDRKSTRLNSSHIPLSRMPSSA